MKVTLKCTYPTGTPPHTDKAGKTIEGDFKTHVAGNVVDLPKPEAERLIGLGHATAGAGAPAAMAEPAKPKKPTGAALTAAVSDAIGTLSPLDEFVNKADKPFVAAIEKVLGYDIMEAERDAGWDAFKSKNPDLFNPDKTAA